MVVKEGPQAEACDTVRMTRLVLTTLGWRTMSETGGAHLNESVALPLPVLTPKKVMVRGFVAQILFGAVSEAKPTATYAPTIMRLIERPTSRWGRYPLIGDCNGRGGV